MLEQGTICLPANVYIDYDDTLGVDCDQSPADVVSFIVPFKCKLKYVGCTVTETCAGGTTTPEFDFDLRPTAGSDTNRGSADLGHLVLSTTAADSSTGALIENSAAAETVARLMGTAVDTTYDLGAMIELPSTIAPASVTLKMLMIGE